MKRRVSFCTFREHYLKSLVICEDQTVRCS